MNGIQDAKMDIVVKGKGENMSKERIDRQIMSMDNRRKDPNDFKYVEEQQND